MRLVEVRDQLTLENQSQLITLAREEYMKLVGLPARDDEKTYYSEIISQIEAINPTDTTSRQLLVQNQECISTIHLLLGRGDFNTMMVYMRSSDVARLPSDIGFLSRIAEKYNVNELRISIGSLHIIL